MLISTFESQKDNLPARGEATWEQLVEGLSQARATSCTVADCRRSECPHKMGASWSPTYWIEGAKRGNAGVEGVSALIVDNDHLTPDRLNEILERIAACRYFIHASHSDRPEDRCVRIGFALSRPVLASEWNRFWRAAVTLIGLPADEQTKDMARLFFLPARPADACGTELDGTGYLFYSQDGAVLDVDAILAAAPPEPTIEPRESFDIPEFAGAPSEEALEDAALVLGQAWPDSGRHGAQLALAGALARAGWPVDLIADFCAAVAHVQQPGNTMSDKRRQAARSSVDKVQAGENVQGWPTLIELLDEEVVNQARVLLGMQLEGDPGLVLAFSELAAKSAAASRVETQTTTASADAIDKSIQQELRQAIAEAPPVPTPVLSPGIRVPLIVEVESGIEEAERKLRTRKDQDAIRDCKFLKKVIRGELLTDSPNENRREALMFAAVAVARSVPPGTTRDQIHSVLLASAGMEAPGLPDIIEQALHFSTRMSPLAGKSSTAGQHREPVLDEFVIQTIGPAAGKPSNKSQHNVDVALQRLGTTFSYNAFSQRKNIERNGVQAILQDKDVDGLFFEIDRKFEIQPEHGWFQKYLGVISHMNSYHPVLDYLATLPPWDGVPRVDSWLIDCAKVEDTEFVRAISKLVLVAAVRRVRQPGCKFDEMLILEGEQGTLKSSALQALCPNREWFADNFQLGDDTKKMIEQTSGKWIVEAGELKGMAAKDQNALKAYLSSTVDEARMAYAREPQRVMRQFIIIGTTNDAQYLKDPSGDRRFWPVTVGQFDVDKILAIRDQLWAEAAQLDLENPAPEYIRLSPSLYAAAAAEQEKRKVDHPYQIILEDALGDAVGRLRTQDAWKLLGFTEKPPTPSEQSNVATALHTLGFKKRQFRVGKSRPTFYVKGEGEERDVLLTVVGNSGSGWKIKPAAPTLGPGPSDKPVWPGGN